MAFRILQLPYLARKEIIGQMTILDLFDLAQCSKKTRHIVKTENKAKVLTMAILVDSLFHFILEDHTKFRVIPKKQLDETQVVQRRRFGRFDNIPSYQDASDDDNTRMETYWSDIWIGAKQMWKELNELFRIKFRVVHIDFDELNVEYQPLIRWLNNIEHGPKYHDLHGDRLDFGQYMWVLENVKAANYVIMAAEPREYFKKGTFKIDTKTVRISHGRWVEVKHLQSMECSYITIFKSSLTDQDFNHFMKGFVAGSNANLQRISIEFGRENDMNVVLNGLQFDKEEEERVCWKVPKENGDVCCIWMGTLDQQGLGLEIVVEKKT